jgi:hypothetical protein
MCEDFQNGTLTRNGTAECAKYEVRRYSGGTNEEYIEIDVLMTKSGGNLNISLQNRLLTVGKYTMGNGEFFFGFPQLNGRTSNTLTITSIDREKNIMSGEFEFLGTGAASFEAFDVKFQGKFKDLKFIK